MPPLGLTDRQLEEVADLCRLIPVARRGLYLELLARRLRDQEIGDGSLRQIATALWHDFVVQYAGSRFMGGGDDGAA